MDHSNILDLMFIQPFVELWGICLETFGTGFFLYPKRIFFVPKNLEDSFCTQKGFFLYPTKHRKWFKTLIRGRKWYFSDAIRLINFGLRNPGPKPRPRPKLKR